MPAAFGAAELIGIALFMLMFALLYATKWTVEPIVAALHSLLGWVPGLGRMVDRVDRAVLNALDGAIHSVEGTIVVLFHGLVWSFDETLTGLEDFTHGVVDAMRYLHNKAIPDAVHAITGATATAVAALEHKSLDVLRKTFDFVAALEAKIVHMGQATYDSVARDIHALTHDDIAAAEARAERAGRDALAVLKTAEDTAISHAQAVGQAALDKLTAAEAVVADEVLHLPGLALDDLERLLHGVDWKKIGGVVGAVPLIYALIHALEAEAGLGNRECRNKVKQICSTDPHKWAHLLEGLAAVGLLFSLEELAAIARPIVDTLEPVIKRAA